MHDESRPVGADGPVRQPEWSAPRLKRLPGRDAVHGTSGMGNDSVGRASAGGS
jgi:hypothetical protein